MQENQSASVRVERGPGSVLPENLVQRVKRWVLGKIHEIEESELEKPRLVPWLAKHYLTWRTYVVFHILLGILLFTHMTNFAAFSYVITGYFFQKFYGIMALLSHLSIYWQLFGMIGSDGVFPLADTMEKRRVRGTTFWKFPTVFWYDTSDSFIRIISYTGMACCILFGLGVLPPVTGALSTFIYLSFRNVGRVFFNLQFDALVVEVGWMVTLMYPLELLSSHTLLRLHIGAGACKITSGDKTWRNLTALTWHYWTTPIPNWVGWYVWSYQPRWLHMLSVASHFTIELISMALVFIPQTRLLAFLSIAALQIAIIMTGNFGAFNYYTILCAFTIIEDSWYPQFIRDYFPSLETNNRFQHLVSPVEDLPRVFHSLFSVDLISIIWYSVSFAISVTITAITILHFLICLQQGIPMLRRFFFMSPKPRHAWRNLGTLDIEKERVANQYWIDILNTWADKLKDFPTFYTWKKLPEEEYLEDESQVSPGEKSPEEAKREEKKMACSVCALMNAAVESLLEFWEQVVSSTHLYCIVNCYAVFSVMTLYRHEIIIEGWDETKKEWREYQLWYKPGEVKRAPPFLFPGHLPRLDWMLWFCGLRTDYWTRDVMVKLLKGSQQTLTMFQYNPFPAEPPKYVRFTKWEYTFTTKEEEDTGRWWNRKFIGYYDKVFALTADAQNLVVVDDPDPLY